MQRITNAALMPDVPIPNLPGRPARKTEKRFRCRQVIEIVVVDAGTIPYQKQPKKGTLPG